MAISQDSVWLLFLSAGSVSPYNFLIASGVKGGGMQKVHLSLEPLLSTDKAKQCTDASVMSTCVDACVEVSNALPQY